MPFVEVMSSVGAASPEAATALILDVSQAVAESLGKPETDLAVRLFAPVPMVFRRSKDPCCVVRVRAIGEPSATQMAALIESCTARVCDALGMPAEQVMVTFTNEPREHWGVGGKPH